MKIGDSITTLDTPQVLIDLNIVDENTKRLFSAAAQRNVDVRVHFKSLKCTGLAHYVAEKGTSKFLCAKLSEAEALAGAGFTDILIANQIVGATKLQRMASLAKRTQLRVCVDAAENIDAISEAMVAEKAEIGILVEVDIGMVRCGVTNAGDAVALAKRIADRPGLRFDGLQGYDGHLQQVPDMNERRAKSHQATEQLLAVKRAIEDAGIAVKVVTGAGTGTWEFVSECEGVTEIQPGSFILMDATYHRLQPFFACSLSILTTVISRRPGQYILDAGSKAISKDFGTPVVKDHPHDEVVALAEEHTYVKTQDDVRIGDKREVYPTHCCATMNLHRQCIAVRDGKVEAIWPIEASGRYD